MASRAAVTAAPNRGPRGSMPGGDGFGVSAARALALGLGAVVESDIGALVLWCSGALVLWWDSWAKAASARAGVRGPEVREWIAPRILWRFGEAWFEVVMRAMTRVMLALALDQAADWQGRGQYLTIAVNLSASSLVDTHLPEEVAAMIAARGVPPCV